MQSNPRLCNCLETCHCSQLRSKSSDPGRDCGGRELQGRGAKVASRSQWQLSITRKQEKASSLFYTSSPTFPSGPRACLSLAGLRESLRHVAQGEHPWFAGGRTVADKKRPLSGNRFLLRGVLVVGEKWPSFLKEPTH